MASGSRRELNPWGSMTMRSSRKQDPGAMSGDHSVHRREWEICSRRRGT
jgi:hypothetical protein